MRFILCTAVCSCGRFSEGRDVNETDALLMCNQAHGLEFGHTLDGEPRFAEKETKNDTSNDNGDANRVIGERYGKKR